jgi:hypothetical protein
MSTIHHTFYMANWGALWRICTSSICSICFTCGVYGWETRILLAENEKLWLFEYLIAGFLFWVKFFSHLVTKNKLKSSATQTQDFCERNVLKLQDLEEVLLEVLLSSLTHNPNLADSSCGWFACVATHHKIGKKKKKKEKENPAW